MSKPRLSNLAPVAAPATDAPALLFITLEAAPGVGALRKARAAIARDVKLPSGAWIAWGGQYEHLLAARARLAVVVPLCFVLIFLLLYTTFRAVRPALLVFTGVPLALTGGVAALALRGLPFSISACAFSLSAWACC